LGAGQGAVRRQTKGKRQCAAELATYLRTAASRKREAPLSSSETPPDFPFFSENPAAYAKKIRRAQRAEQSVLIFEKYWTF